MNQSLHLSSLAGALWLLTAVTFANSAALTDPTRPYGAGNIGGIAPFNTVPYTLNSTLVSPARRVAVINGKHVAEGDRIGSATVLKINKHEVLLMSTSRKITLKLLPDIVKKQP